jgi:hypothetical protein
MILAALALAVEPGQGAGPILNIKPQDKGGLAALLSLRSTDALAGALRGYLVRAFPEPLYEAGPGWGHTRKILGHSKNQGTWRKVRISAVNLPDTLVLDIRDVRVPETGRLTFTLYIAFDARLDFQQQKWEAGVRLYDASARARLRVRLTLGGEVTSRLGPAVFLLPEAVLGIRLLSADLRLDNFVTEHVAGLGGEAAKLLGDAIKGGLREWRPGLQQSLTARANAAIVKSAGAKEIRLSWIQVWKALNSGRPVDQDRVPTREAKTIPGGKP